MNVSKRNRIQMLKTFVSVLVVLVVGTTSDRISQGSQDQVPQPRPCKVWSYGYSTGKQTFTNNVTGEIVQQDWDAWHYKNFPEDCDFDNSLNMICRWPDANSACAAYTLENQKADKLNGVRGAGGTYKNIYLGAYPANQVHPTSRACRFRVKGVLDSRQTDVSEEGHAMETYCNTSVLGPYSNCSDAYRGKNSQIYYYGERGAKFSDAQKELILQLNRTKPGHGNMLQSDILATSVAGFTPTCSGPLHDPDTAAANDKCRAEVHHLVPIRDTQGCDCGRNSFKNAIVISNELNNWIRNNPDRAQVIMNFLPLPFYEDRGNCKPHRNLSLFFQLLNLDYGELGYFGS